MKDLPIAEACVTLRREADEGAWSRTRREVAIDATIACSHRDPRLRKMSTLNLSKKRVVVAMLIAAALLAAAFHVYAISEGAGGFAIWNRTEAYFFIQVDRRGESSSYLLFPWMLFKEYVIGGFAGAVEPADMRAFLVVLHVTPAGVDRRIVKLADRANGGAGSDPKRFTPIGGSVYAMCPGLRVCRWTGDRFENLTQQEQDGIGGVGRLTEENFENDDGGWSRRVFVAGQAEPRFAIQVGNQFKLDVDCGEAGNTKEGAVSVDLERPGKASEAIARFQIREGSVGRTEYRHAFRDPE